MQIERLIKKIHGLKLNIFDYLVIFLLFTVFTSLLIIRYSKKTEWINVRLKVSNNDWWWEGKAPDYWYLDQLKQGQESFNTYGDKTAFIEDFNVYDIGGYRRQALINLKLKVTFDKKRDIYLYNYQPLQIGKPLDLTFGKQNLSGLITYIGSEKIDYFDKKIKVKIISIYPWLADSYQKGMTMKDSEGRIVAEIIDVKKESSRYQEFSDLRGTLITVTNPEFKDVEVTLKIKVFKNMETYYFIDGASIKIDEIIWFQFADTVIKDARIIEIIDN